MDVRSPASPANRSTAATNAPTSSGGTATPAPASPTTRATSLPSSTLAISGRPAARIEYILEGTLLADRPRRSATT